MLQLSSFTCAPACWQSRPIGWNMLLFCLHRRRSGRTHKHLKDCLYKKYVLNPHKLTEPTPLTWQSILLTVTPTHRLRDVMDDIISFPQIWAAWFIWWQAKVCFYDQSLTRRQVEVKWWLGSLALACLASYVCHNVANAKFTLLASTLLVKIYYFPDVLGFHCGVILVSVSRYFGRYQIKVIF